MIKSGSLPPLLFRAVLLRTGQDGVVGSGSSVHGEHGEQPGLRQTGKALRSTSTSIHRKGLVLVYRRGVVWAFVQALYVFVTAGLLML